MFHHWAPEVHTCDKPTGNWYSPMYLYQTAINLCECVRANYVEPVRVLASLAFRLHRLKPVAIPKEAFQASLIKKHLLTLIAVRRGSGVRPFSIPKKYNNMERMADLSPSPGGKGEGHLYDTVYVDSKMF